MQNTQTDKFHPYIALSDPGSMHFWSVSSPLEDNNDNDNGISIYHCPLIAGRLT